MIPKRIVGHRKCWCLTCNRQCKSMALTNTSECFAGYLSVCNGNSATQRLIVRETVLVLGTRGCVHIIPCHNESSGLTWSTRRSWIKSRSKIFTDNNHVFISPSAHHFASRRWSDRNICNCWGFVRSYHGRCRHATFPVVIDSFKFPCMVFANSFNCFAFHLRVCYSDFAFFGTVQIGSGTVITLQFSIQRTHVCTCQYNKMFTLSGNMCSIECTNCTVNSNACYDRRCITCSMRTITCCIAFNTGPIGTGNHTNFPNVVGTKTCRRGTIKLCIGIARIVDHTGGRKPCL